MKQRDKAIEHAINMTEATLEALHDMRKTPDAPADLSRHPVGCFAVLQKLDVRVFFDGDQVFGIMSAEDGESD